MVVADFNQDAKPDIAIKRWAVVVVLLGLGNGSFTSQINSNLFYGPNLAGGDFNNDGKPDLLTYDNYGGAVLLGDGAGHFQAPTNSVSLSYPGGLAVGDFNGDAKLDLASQGMVALGRGDGSFGSPIYYNVWGGPGGLRAGDIDRNGRLDLVVAVSGSGPANSRCFASLSGQGDGTFATPQYYVAVLGQDERSLELADVNRDGSLDVAIANRNAGSVTIWLNDGTGAFGLAHDYALGFSVRSVAAADFNGDANPDLVIRGGTAAIFLLGHGNGSFTLGFPMSVPSDSGWYPSVGLEDFNGDEMLDTAFLDYYGGAVAVMLNQTPPLLQLTPMPGYHQLSWLTTFGAGYTLEYTTNLAQPVAWHPFPYPPVVIGNQKAVTDWEDQPRKFYRLRKP